MILPIGHADSATRRLPWVTFAIMAICLLALLATNPSGLEIGYEPALLMEEASDYWREHAYLEADPEIRTRVGYDVSPNQRVQYLALIEDQSLAIAPDDPDEWLAQQDELDRLTDYALGRSMPPGVENADNPYREWGFTPSQWTLVTLITGIFMHAGWLHLLGNLFMLFLAGPAVEDRLGRPIFASFYLLAGMFAAIFWALLTPNKDIPLVGASGAIAGVLGAFLIRYWKTDIRFAYFFMFGLRPYWGTFEAKAWVMLPLWLLNEMFQGWIAHSIGMESGVAYMAHVGGFVFGAAAVAAARIFGLEEKYIDSKIEAKVTLAEANPIVQDALAMREQGDHAGALAMLQEAWQSQPGDRDVALSIWDAAQAVDQPELGQAAMVSLVRTCIGAGETELAIRHWMDLTRVLPTALAEPSTLIKFVPALLADADRELAVRALRHAVDPGNRGLSTGLAFRAVELGREIDPPSALRAARAALQSGDVHEAKRARIEGWIQELEAAGVEEASDVVTEDRARRVEAGRREIELPDELDEGIVIPPIPVPAGQPMPAAPPPLPPPVPPPVPPPARQPIELDLDPEPRVELASDPLAEHVGDDISMSVLEGVDHGPRFGSSKIVEATLTDVQEDVIRFTVAGDRRAKLEYHKVEAVSVVAVRGLGPKPVLLIDLLLNWTCLDAEQLQVVRLASNGFDPRALVPEADGAMSAIREIVARIVDESGAVALPSAGAAACQPVAIYDALDVYEREVLQVGG